MAKSAFIERLQQPGPILLDGGLSNQLEARGCDLDHPLWSALLLLQNPEEIVKVHLDYLQAGAQCLITASYQASVLGFAAMGLSERQSRELIVRSVDLARKAIAQFSKTHPDVVPMPLVAASIGPYGAYLADGTEYHGRYNANAEQLKAFHRQRLLWLDNSEADVLALETIPNRVEVAVLAELLHGVSTPAWLSLACADGERLNDGSEIAPVLAGLAEHPNIQAVGVNCTKPQYVPALIDTIKRHAPHKAIVVYPNSAEQYHCEDKSWSGQCDTEQYGRQALDWYRAGAKIIGGCCRIGPHHIAAVKAKIMLEK